jgi:hypothetical protein
MLLYAVGGIMQDNNGRALNPPVIVRAWGDEPVRLFLHRIDNKRCYVGNETSKSPIGLPEDQVFAFDVDRFARLSTAFQQGDVDKLGELWANIPVEDSACNRYQDMLKSLHDQEPFTDSECASSGNNQ